MSYTGNSLGILYYAEGSKYSVSKAMTLLKFTSTNSYLSCLGLRVQSEIAGTNDIIHLTYSLIKANGDITNYYGVIGGSPIITASSKIRWAISLSSTGAT